MNAFCCYLTNADKPLGSGSACGNDAVWLIVEIDPTKHPSECETHACTKHVGDLLTDAPEHWIFPISVEAR